MDEPSDEELMRRVAAGDEPAFRLLARRSVPPAIGFARRILANAADAEDVVQEAMLRVWITAPRWRPEALFRTWLYRVVVNLCLNRKRRASFASLAAAGDPADPRPGAAAELERAERDRAIADAIARLPERQRAAIVLTYREGLSNIDTAAVLGTSVSAVETLLVRAKQSLRRQLGSLAADDD
jgi:RNA polymerase sigma-70 factor (ECF subfamily)